MSSVTSLPEATRTAQMKRWGVAPARTGDHIEPRGAELADLPPDAWSVAYPGSGTETDGGLTAHRGVVHPDEYLDIGVLRDAVCARLGFTWGDVSGVYRRGRLSPADRDLRTRVDAAFLGVARAGGNMAALGRALGWPVTTDGHCPRIARAIRRARAAKEAT